PGPFGHFAQHAGQHEDLDRRPLLGELAAAVAELVAVVVVGVGGDGGQQVDEVGDLRTRQADGDHGRSSRHLRSSYEGVWVRSITKRRWRTFRQRRELITYAPRSGQRIVTVSSWLVSAPKPV